MRYRILFSLLFFLVGCKKKPPYYPPYYIECKIDGQLYRPSNCANCQSAYVVGDSVLLMNANADFETVGVSVTGSPSLFSGTHLIVASRAYYDNNPLVDDIYRTNLQHGGTMILNIDRSAKIVEGVFEFDAYNEKLKKVVKISEGKFRLQYLTF